MLANVSAQTCACTVPADLGDAKNAAETGNV